MIISQYQKPPKSTLDQLFDWIEKNADTYAQILGVLLLTLGILLAWTMIDWTPKKYSSNQVHLLHIWDSEPTDPKLFEIDYTKPVEGNTEYQIYIVQHGDNLWRISQNLGVSLNDLREMNSIQNDLIKEGQELMYKM